MAESAQPNGQPAAKFFAIGPGAPLKYMKLAQGLLGAPQSR